MKKVITLIMSLFLVLGLSGCSNNSQDESSNSSTNENKTEKGKEFQHEEDIDSHTRNLCFRSGEYG